MKRLNKKQKIIISIAVLLIVIIITMLITTNIISNNNQITSEGYLASTANAGSNLIANYIQNGITVGGITGTLEILDTSDATATAEDITEGKVAYARGERIVGTRKDEPDPISGDDLNLSATNVYYADLEGNGTVDGVIFVDLSSEKSGQWMSSYGIYNTPEETNFKQYYIMGDYTDEHFGTGKIITPMEGTGGSNRFYVMSLNDFDSSSYYWYYTAYGRLDSETSVMPDENDFATVGAEPTGKVNTKRMIEIWNNEDIGTQNEEDMWGQVQDKSANGWFVPSKSEWSAFGATFGINSSNYDNKFGLKDDYWTSSHYLLTVAFRVNFSSSGISTRAVTSSCNIRLATTF